MQVEKIAIKDLTPDPENARTHDSKNLKAIAGSLEQFGQRKPIVITSNGVIIAGNGTVRAAKELGWTHIDATRLPEDWTTDKAKAYALADNRTAELADWDPKILADQLIDLDSMGWDVSSFGFDEINPLIDPSEDDDKPLTFDEEEPTTKPGDLWQIGSHRILCGDSQDILNLDRITAGLTVGCIVTDPPYGIDVHTDWASIANDINKGYAYKKVANDDVPFDATLFRTYFRDVQEQFWFGANYYIRTLTDKDLSGSWLVWDKRTIEVLDNLLGSGFELCWSATPHKQDILRYLWAGFQARERDGKRIHPTQKPVAMLSEILERWTKEGAVIVDPFAGSGSTLVAAARTNRIGIGIELDPFYVDKIVERLEKATGLKATLLTTPDIN